jgi:hypothetical protein
MVPPEVMGMMGTERPDPSLGKAGPRAWVADEVGKAGSEAVHSSSNSPF